MQFDDIKKQLPFTISDADNEYLGLIGSYLRSISKARAKRMAQRNGGRA